VTLEDILKHENDGTPLSPEMNNEPEEDDLMNKLNKISYRDGTMGRLPTTYSFSELDKVPSFGSVSDDDKTPTSTPVSTLRTSTDRRNRQNETAAQAHERKVVIVQSLVRRAQAKKRYKQMRTSLPFIYCF
jgi:hypothetical protein